MKKLLLLPLIAFITSCNSSTQTAKSADENFVGAWQYYKSSFEKGNKDDESMKGLMATIKKIENTNESYNIAYINFDIPFAKENDTLLKSTQGAFIAMYHPSTQHLVLYISNKDYTEFTRMK